MNKLELDPEYTIKSSKQIRDYINETLVPAITELQKRECQDSKDAFTAMMAYRDEITKLEQRIETLERRSPLFDTNKWAEQIDKHFERIEQRIEALENDIHKKPPVYGGFSGYMTETPKPVECNHKWQSDPNYICAGYQYYRCACGEEKLEKLSNTLAAKLSNWLKNNHRAFPSPEEWKYELIRSFCDMSKEHYKPIIDEAKREAYEDKSGRCGEAFYKGRELGRKEAYAEIKRKMQEFYKGMFGEDK